MRLVFSFGLESAPEHPPVQLADTNAAPLPFYRDPLQIYFHPLWYRGGTNRYWRDIGVRRSAAVYPIAVVTGSRSAVGLLECAGCRYQISITAGTMVPAYGRVDFDASSISVP